MRATSSNIYFPQLTQDSHQSFLYKTAAGVETAVVTSAQKKGRSTVQIEILTLN